MRDAGAGEDGRMNRTEGLVKRLGRVATMRLRF